ncbi:MAG: bile acid:sodium symporter family protein [Firmicutes bacterium]|nr:bile acid:sodium symporter family protein [Bacillota bacterium]
MKNMYSALSRVSWKYAFVAAFLVLLFISCASAVSAGEELYRSLSGRAVKGETGYFKILAEQGEIIDWGKASPVEFEGNLRFLEVEGQDEGLFMVRRLDGELYLVSIPAAIEKEEKEPPAAYLGLENMLGDKLVFKALIAESVVNGEIFTFLRFVEKPQQLLLDRIFKTSIMFMFFFVMIGMGLSLTLQDFILVFKKPKGIIAGIFMQWILMPLLALGMAYALGFYHSFPFIYAGMVLICACPGGVTSNLMTYYAKGDLALSVSLTSISTVLALFITPFVLTLFCANIPDINVPAGLIMQTIIGLVLVPLVLGMLIRKKWEAFAQKAMPFFSAVGVLALLAVIGVGIITNAEKFADTARYSFLFYVMVVLLSILGMLVALGTSRLLGITNIQSRAISIEVGLRNSTLAVTIALLIQDLMGDFYSSMFVTTAIYGITMYLTGFLMIWLYKYLLPLEAGGKPGVEASLR